MMEPVAALPLLAAVALHAAAFGAPAAGAPAPAEPFRIVLTGDPASATPFAREDFGIIPFGGFVNALPLEHVQQGGVQFSAELTSCGGRGCVVETADGGRVLVGKRGIADAIKLDLYEQGWQRNGQGAISEDGVVALPVTAPDGSKREIWLVRSNGHLAKRLPNPNTMPVILHWRGDDLFIQTRALADTGFTRISTESGRVSSATLLDPWLYRCTEDSAAPIAYTPGWLLQGELRGLTTVPLYRANGSEMGVLELTASIRPMTTQGFTSPVHIQTDCLGRFCVITAMGDEVWCLRFLPSGKLERASALFGSLAGNASAVQIDEHGRFYYLEVEMDENGQTPARIHLLRLK